MTEKELLKIGFRRIELDDKTDEHCYVKEYEHIGYHIEIDPNALTMILADLEGNIIGYFADWGSLLLTEVKMSFSNKVVDKHICMIHEAVEELFPNKPKQTS